jgi:hypothetical protein
MARNNKGKGKGKGMQAIADVVESMQAVEPTPTPTPEPIPTPEPEPTQDAPIPGDTPTDELVDHVVAPNPAPALPRMPKARKAKAMHVCACGCGRMTKGTWFPGDDGRATGWAVRIEKGLMTLEQVPENNQPGATLMLARRAGDVEAAA